MSFIYARNSEAGVMQVNERDALRRVHNATERHLAALQRDAGIAVNAIGEIGPRAWLDLDTQTVQLIDQEADVIFQDLMPLARSVSIGKFVAAYRRLGAMDAGNSSLSGQLSHLLGNTGYDYDGIVVPVHAKSFGRQWREVEATRSIGMDELADDQAAATREVLRLMTVNMMDGNANLNYQGVGSYGIRNNPNTLAITLLVDLTASATTFAQADGEFNRVIQQVRGGSNRVTAPVTVYISPEIEANWSRRSGATTQDRTWLAALAETPGVAAIKTSQELSGNEMVGLVLNSAYVQPVVGQAVGTTPIPRTRPFEDFHFMTWGASGLLIKADQGGRSGAFYATGA